MTGARIFSIFLFAGLIGLWNLSPASAAGGVCTAPAGNEGDLIYNDDYDIVQYCTGSNIWLKLGGGTVDSRIGTLQNSKWCATNAGGVIQCDQNAPSGVVGADKEVQFNNSSAMGGATKLIWDESAGALAVGTSSAAAASSVLELSSTAKGFLPPRMTTTQRDAISSPATGLMIFNSTNAQLEIYTGSAWAGLGGLSTGAIAAFASTTCPSGWSEYTAARGRFLRGIDNGAGNDPSGTRAPGAIQADMTKISMSADSGVVGGNIYNPSPTSSTLRFETSGSFGSVGGSGVETRPKNVAVIFCQYNGVGNVPATATVNGTANYVAKFTGPSNVGNSQIYDDGTNVGIGTVSPGGIFQVTKDSTYNIDTTAGLRITNATTPAKMLAAGYDGSLDAAYVQSLHSGTAYKTLLLNPNGGNVGIGTAAPGAPLDVQNAGTSVRLAQFLAPNQGNGLLSQIVIGKDTTTNYAQGTVTYTYNSTTPSSSYISLGNATVNSAMLNVLGNGFVGIGTQTPKSPLDVSGAVTLDPSYATYLVNSYYDGAWRYVGNGVAWGIGNNFGGSADGVSIARAPANSSGANAALTWTPVFNIDSTNRVGIGTASPAFKLDVNGGSASITDANATLALNGTSGNWDGYISFRGSGTEYWHVGAYHPDGALYLQGAATTDMRVMPGSNSWAATSDKRLKSNIETLHVLDRLGSYRAVSFNWKETGRHDIGVVAQELYKVFPEVVNKGSDGDVLTPGKDGVWSVQYDKLGALALEAVKELKADNDNLRADSEKQQAELLELREEVKALKAATH